MQDLLKQIAEEKKIELDMVQQILKIEKDHVYQKRRRTRGAIKQLISEKCGGSESNDH